MQEKADKNSLCILIPTCNRSKAINFYLEKRLGIFAECGFDMIIYDSSKDDLTRNVAEKYIQKGYSCLKYVHYEDPAGDFYGNRKTENALCACAKEYEYVWLCGDHAVLCLEDYKDELFRLLEGGYDVIHIYPNKMGIESTRDMDYKVFFEQFFWSMTHWCSFVLSKRLIHAMDRWMTEYLKLNVTTLVVLSVFAALAKGNFKIAYINHVAFRHSPYRELGTAIEHKDMLRGFAEMIDVGVSNLPDEYDGLKSTAKKGFTQNTGTFSRKGAIELRAGGSLTLKKLSQYKNHVRQVTDVPISWFYLWCLVPEYFARKISYSYKRQQESRKCLLELEKQGSKVVLYGAGEHGIWIYEKIKYVYTGMEVIALSDKNWAKMNGEYPVIPPGDISEYKYDYVGIAIVNKMIYEEVRKEFIRAGIPGEKIIHL